MWKGGGSQTSDMLGITSGGVHVIALRDWYVDGSKILGLFSSLDFLVGYLCHRRQNRLTHLFYRKRHEVLACAAGDVLAEGIF